MHELFYPFIFMCQNKGYQQTLNVHLLKVIIVKIIMLLAAFSAAVSYVTNIAPCHLICCAELKLSR